MGLPPGNGLRKCCDLLEIGWRPWRRGTLEAGAGVRRLRDDGYTNRYQFNPFAVRRLDLYRGTGLLGGGYAQHAVGFSPGRLHLAAGARWDRHSVSGANVYSPFASLALSPRASKSGRELVWRACSM